MAKQPTYIASILQNYADECRRIMDEERDLLLQRVQRIERTLDAMFSTGETYLAQSIWEGRR